MINAFLFPGQGSQSVGMGAELYEKDPDARRILDKACGILRYDLRDIMFHGPAEKLTDTRFAQPAVYTCSAMYLEKARQEGIGFEYVAGHSLGEYSALYAAGVYSFEEGLRLVSIRGRAMSEENGKGTMAAVLGLTEEELRPYIAMVPDVVMANFNTGTQIVISGSKEGIDKVMAALSDREGVHVRGMNVSAAFHSPQMRNAADIMEKEIEAVTFHAPRAVVVPNVTGRPTKDAETLKKNLFAQIMGQVRWADSILAMKKNGVEAFYEVGNGHVLRKLNRAIIPQPRCRNI